MKNKYSKYKPSGVEWIGDIPDHWVKTKVKHVVEIFGRIGYRGYTIEDIVNEGEGVITISPSNIQKDLFVIDNGVTYISYEKYYQSPEIMIFPNDIILVKTGSTIGKTSIIPEGVPEMTINPQLVVLKKIKTNPKHFYYQTLCNYIKESFEVEQTGSTTPTISQEKINEFPILNPPLPEQEQIVKYLDEQTGEIDNLISITEKKIELLKENRTSTINRVITKGLDPNVELKDSGIEWIGEIPKHWTKSSIKYINKKVGSGVTPRGGSEVYVDEGVIFIRSQNVHFDGLRLDDVVKIEPDTHEKMSGTKVLFNDVLLNITGGSIGRCCIVETSEEMNVNQHVCIIRPNENIKPRFLNLFLQSSIGQTQVDLFITGGNREGLNIENIKNFFVPLPLLSEQEEIVKYLDQITQDIDNLISIEQQRIETLKEYRQSLISEVITGKVRVCEEVKL